MDMNIRNVPDELISRIREHAANRHLTLRAYVLLKLAKTVGYKGRLADPYMICPACGSRKVNGNK